MSEVSRRVAIQALAGTAVAAGGSGFVRAGPTVGVTRGKPDPIPARLLYQALEIEPPTDDAPKGHVVQARLGLVRSSSSRVYLYAGPSLAGVVDLDDRGHAMACAAAAVAASNNDFTVFARVWGHDPCWGNGVGRFDGAVLAFNPNDLLPVHLKSRLA